MVNEIHTYTKCVYSYGTKLSLVLKKSFSLANRSKNIHRVTNPLCFDRLGKENHKANIRLSLFVTLSLRTVKYP